MIAVDVERGPTCARGPNNVTNPLKAIAAILRVRKAMTNIPISQIAELQMDEHQDLIVTDLVDIGGPQTYIFVAFAITFYTTTAVAGRTRVSLYVDFAIFLGGFQNVAF